MKERAVFWGGGLAVLAGLVMLLDRGGASIPVDQHYVFLFWNTISRVTEGALLAAGFLLAAFGRRAGRRLPGRRIWPAVMLAFFGGVQVLQDAALLAFSSVPQGAGLAATSIQLVAAAAGLAAAVAVYRSGVVGKVTRLLLLVAVVDFALFSAIALIPSSATFALANTVAGLFPLMLIAFGASLMVDIRRHTIRNHIDLVREHW